MLNVTYLILAHQDPQHLARLISRFDDRAEFVVHVDSKAALPAFQKHVRRDHVAWVSDRRDVRWAGWSMVEATKSLIRTALDRGARSSHFVLLSGSDYPIKPPARIHELLQSDPSHNFIQWIDVRDSPEHYERSVRRHHLFEWIPTRPGLRGKLRTAVRRVGGRVLSTLSPKRLRPSFIYAFGSQWWALTPECARYAVSTNDVTRHAEQVLKTAMAPDELYFHTVVANSPYAAMATGRQPYTGRGSHKLANLHIIDASLTKWFGLGDLPQIRASERLFVRKVATSCAPLLDAIDETLGASGR